MLISTQGSRNKTDGPRERNAGQQDGSDEPEKPQDVRDRRGVHFQLRGFRVRQLPPDHVRGAPGNRRQDHAAAEQFVVF